MREAGADDFKAVFSSASLAMVLLDRSGSIVRHNDAFTRLFPALRDGTSLPDWFKDHQAPLVAFHFAALVNGSVPSLAIETPCQDEANSKRLLEVQAWRLPATPDRENLFCFQIADSTKRQNEARQLLKAKELAERSTETKSQFLANMSHEIRTPIQTMLGMTELLQETRLDREQSEYLRQLRFSTDVLLSLINDILDYSKIEANKLSIESIEVDLESVLEQASDMVCLEAHRKNLEILIDIAADAPTAIRGDPNRIRQVIVNLAKNAVKFTSEGSVILRLRRTTLNRREAISFAIIDTGIGIRAEQRKGLFTTFFQADSSTTRRFGGTGLGLAISKHLVELFGGRIGMSDNSPRGSIFSFSIPVEVLPEPQRFTLPPVKSDERILIVDDHSETRTVLSSYLTSFGYASILEADSGYEALRILQAASMQGRPIGLCLIDMVMPTMDGWRLAAEINANPAINSSKLILMVPQGTLGADAKMTLLKWFNAYTNKPVKRRDLAGALQECCAIPVDLDKAAPGDDEGLKRRRPEHMPGSFEEASGEVAELEELEEVVEEKEESADSSGPGPLVRGHVLIAEDHEINQKLLSLILERAGFTVAGAADGLEAVAAVERDHFDLIFMDIQMPRLNGYEASERIRAAGVKTPILAVTASALSDEKERCLAAGMNDTIVKPFHRADIMKALDHWLPPDGAARPAPMPKPCGPASGPSSGSASGGAEQGEKTVPATSCDEGESRQHILDRKALNYAFMGNTDTIRSLLGRYLERTGETVAGLEGLLDREDWERFLLDTHTIKGSASNLSAGELTRTALAAELAARAQDMEAARASVAPLRTAFERFSAEARAYLEEES